MFLGRGGGGGKGASSGSLGSHFTIPAVEGGSGELTHAGMALPPRSFLPNSPPNPAGTEGVWVSSCYTRSWTVFPFPINILS